jgi:hypothetical protein
MNTITITIEQYNKIKRLATFAQWYVQEHEGASGSKEMIEQWEEDRDEVERGINTIQYLDQEIDWQIEQAKRSERTDAWIKQANKEIREGNV